MAMFKYGRRPYVRDERVPQFKAIMRDVELPPVPDEIDWLSALEPDCGIYGNDEWGDCFFAGAYHQAQLWLKQVSKLDASETTETVLQAYSECTGFNQNDPTTDNGTDPNDGLKYWMNTGLPTGTLGGRRKIRGFFECRPQDVNRVMWECGGVGLGIKVFKNIQPDDGSPPPDVWDFVPGSEVAGLHYVVAGKWSKKDGLYFIETWGASKRYALTENYMQNGLDVAYGVISDEWVNGYTKKTPLGLTLAHWDAQMNALREAA
jgi:hypothetical protein